MPELVLDGFPGGEADLVVDGLPTTARQLRNIWLNRQGKACMRPGTELLTHAGNGERVVDMLPYTAIPGNNKKMVYMANGLIHQAMGDVYPTGSVSVMTFPNGMAYQSGSKGMLAKDQAHIYGVSADGYPVKFFMRFVGSNHVPTLLQAGLPKPEISGFISANPGTGSDTYSHVYYAVFHRFYYVNGTRFEDYGEPLTFTVQWTGAAIGSSGSSANVPITIDDIASMASNYLGRFGFATDDSNECSLHCEIYRTVNNGTIPYYVMSIDSADPFGQRIDNVDDSTIITRKTLYSIAQAKTHLTPFAKRMTIADNTGWYSNIKVTNPKYAVGLYTSGVASSHEYGENVLYQSVPGDIDGVPSTFYYRLNDEITGLGAIDIYPIVFERNKIWRVEGKFGLDGSGGGVLRLVADGVGCVGGFGVVNVGGALVFPGNDQFYITDGFQVKPYSPHIKDSYKRRFDFGANSWNESDYIRGFFSKTKQRAFWTVPGAATSNSATPAVHEAFVLNKELSGDYGSFTSMAGEPEDTVSMTHLGTKNFRRPEYHTFGELPSGVLVHSDLYGWLKNFDDRLMTDDIIDANNSSVPMQSSVQPYVSTAAWSFGSETQKKWFSRIEFSLRSEPVLAGAEERCFIGSVIGPTTQIKLEDSFNPAVPSLVGYYVRLTKLDGTLISVNKILTHDKATKFITVDAVLVSQYAYMSVFRSSLFMSADIWSSNDLNRLYVPMRQYRDRVTVGKLLQVFDRMVPKNGIRSTYKEFKIGKAFAVIHKSSDFSSATFTAVSAYNATAVLSSGIWPSGIQGQWIVPDAYPDRRYRILYVSGNTMVIRIGDDPGNAVWGGSPAVLAWTIKGYAKDEWFMLNKITIPYQVTGESIKPFQATDLGGNP